ncbi:Lateral signaling target protein 2 [Balamuthia mandrillaris]
MQSERSKAQRRKAEEARQKRMQEQRERMEQRQKAARDQYLSDMARKVAHYRADVQQEVLARRPDWVPDSKAPHCMACSAKFVPVFRRRHHCRSCGRVLCKQCCSNWKVLPELGYFATPVRSCNDCHRQREGTPGSASVSTQPALQQLAQSTGGAPTATSKKETAAADSSSSASSSASSSSSSRANANSNSSNNKGKGKEEHHEEDTGAGMRMQVVAANSEEQNFSSSSATEGEEEKLG